MKHLRILGLLVALGLLFSAAAVANTPPVAVFEVSASPDGSQTTLVLDASRSHDPDGSIVAYQWIYGDGFSGSGVTKTHTFPAIKTYTITLLVRDDAGASHIATQTVDLSSPLPSAQETPEQTPIQTTPAPVVVPLNISIGNRTGERAPGFSLPNRSGELVSLSDFLGRPVLIEFWSSSCSACQASLPHLESLRETYSDRGLVVITITINRNVEGEWQYLEQHGFTDFVALREADLNNRPTKEAYGVSVIPTAYLIDQRGVIYYKGHINFVQPDLIEELL